MRGEKFCMVELKVWLEGQGTARFVSTTKMQKKGEGTWKKIETTLLSKKKKKHYHLTNLDNKAYSVAVFLQIA